MLGNKNLFSYVGYVYNNIEKILCVSFLVIMSLFVFLQLVFRYLINFQAGINPIVFSEELARYSYVWITFIGISWASKEKKHIKVTFFVELLPQKYQKLLNILVDIISSLILILLFLLSIRFMIFQTGRVSPALQIPMFLVYLSLPLGFGLTSIRLIEMVYNEVKDLRKTMS